MPQAPRIMSMRDNRFGAGRLTWFERSEIARRVTAWAPHRGSGDGDKRPSKYRSTRSWGRGNRFKI